MKIWVQNKRPPPSQASASTSSQSPVLPFRPRVAKQKYAPIFNLPSHLLYYLLSQLCPHCVPSAKPCLDPFGHRSCPQVETHRHNLRTLSRLAQTCKLFRDLAVPILYHSPMAGDRYLPLARTLATRPDLRGHVKRLHVEGWQEQALRNDEVAWLGNLPDQLGLTAVTEEWLAAFRESVAQWRRHPGWQRYATNIALLLIAACPNVEDVAIYGMLDPALPPIFKLPRLRKLALVRPGGIELGTSLVDRAGPLTVSSSNLRHLLATKLSHISEDLSLRVGQLRHLELRMCALSQTTLAMLLERCPLLEKFAYSSSRTSSDQFSARQAKELIVQHLPGLKSLELQLRACAPLQQPNWARDERPAWLASMDDLAMLEELIVDSAALQPEVRMFPVFDPQLLATPLSPSLRRLQLNLFPSYLAGDSFAQRPEKLSVPANALALALSIRFVRLKEVKVIAPKGLITSDVTDAFREKGIAFSYGHHDV